jgi:hypothetical protein
MSSEINRTRPIKKVLLPQGILHLPRFPSRCHISHPIAIMSNQLTCEVSDFNYQLVKLVLTWTFSFRNTFLAQHTYVVFQLKIWRTGVS